ncbi:hypothetical protein ACFT7S_10315 [Streptomyces sp. NPDC057136]|uniref:hypothetical protein n=1 Tax=Streptomyces sp. NPDC057136 TaxID=3346029 RepID=UPI00363355ED
MADGLVDAGQLLVRLGSVPVEVAAEQSQALAERTVMGFERSGDQTVELEGREGVLVFVEPEYADGGVAQVDTALRWLGSPPGRHDGLSKADRVGRTDAGAGEVGT